MRLMANAGRNKKGEGESWIGSINSLEFASILQGAKRKILDYRGFELPHGSNGLMIHEAPQQMDL